jgi:Protein of unknown function (DUF2568)
MSQSELVLGLHVALELAALAAFAFWGWTTHDGVLRWLWAIGLPIVAALAWALFRTVGDGPEPTVAIPGTARLALELIILIGAAVLVAAADLPLIGAVFGVLILADYALSYDRVLRLLGAS